MARRGGGASRRRPRTDSPRVSGVASVAAEAIISHFGALVNPTLAETQGLCRPADRVADCPPNGAAVSLAPAQSFPGRTRPLSPFRYGCLPACGRICCHIDRGDPLRAQGNPLCPREYTRYPVHTLPSGECACRPCGCAVALLRLLVSPPVGESATTPRVRRHAEEGGALTLPSERAAGGEGETSCAGSPGGRGAGAWVGAAGGAAALGSPDGGIRRGLSARPRGGRALR